MKKKVILVSISILLVLIIIIVYTNKEEDTSFQDTTKQVFQENTLSMMIEQTAEAGDYKLETRSSWPTSGYLMKHYQNVKMEVHYHGILLMVQ